MTAKTPLEYIKTKKESISAHTAWGLVVYGIVYVRFGKPALAAVLAVILFGVAWEVIGEIVSSILAHHKDRNWGGCSVDVTQAARRVGYVRRLVSDLKQPEIWKANIWDALTFWPGWIAGYFIWRGFFVWRM